VAVHPQLRKNDVVQYKGKDNDEEYANGMLVSRAAKASGKRSDLWNVKDMATGDIQWRDLSKVSELRKMPDNKDEHENVLVMTTTTIFENKDKKGSQLMDGIEQVLMTADECGRSCGSCKDGRKRDDYNSQEAGVRRVFYTSLGLRRLLYIGECEMSLRSLQTSEYGVQDEDVQ
jgi:hypothetical protein